MTTTDFWGSSLWIAIERIGCAKIDCRLVFWKRIFVIYSKIDDFTLEEGCDSILLETQTASYP